MNAERPRTDWEDIRRRLREAAAVKGWAENRERAAVVYAARAARLAARGEGERGADTTGSLSVLGCRVEGERYGIELAALLEVTLLTRRTPLPEAPPEHLGVVNRRGEIEPVADLARILGLPASGKAEAGYVLTLRLPGQAVGLRVDGVDDILAVARGTLQPLPPSSAAARYALGVAPDGLIVLAPQELACHAAFKESSR